MSSESAGTAAPAAPADGARRVVFAGGHGQFALLAQRRLAAEGHRPVGLSARQSTPTTCAPSAPSR